MDVKYLKWLRIAWLISTLSSIFYFVLIYVLPSTGFLFRIAVPMKLLIESLLLLFPPITGSIVVGFRIKSQEIVTSIEGNVFVVSLGESIVATCVLQLNSVTGSVKMEENGECVYGVSALLALREGMEKDTTIAYEVGTFGQEPFIRIFITTLGDSLRTMKQRLNIEATRAEAILRSSLNTIEMKRLSGLELKKAIQTMREANFGVGNQERERTEKLYRRTIAITGQPSIRADKDGTQIGAFLAGLLRQAYNASLTCAFRPANSGKEKVTLERRWKNIRRKEREKRESLSDHAAKTKLLERYQEISAVDAWFEASIYVTLEAGSEAKLKLVEEGVRGLIVSIWGESGEISSEIVNLGKRNYYRVLSRRVVNSSRIHLNRLVAYFNTPSQHLPVLTGKRMPEFSIPEKDVIDNKLVIGRAVFNSRCLGNVGLKEEWLREHIAIMGATGTGKTTLVKRLIAELSTKTEVPWLIFDVKGSEYVDLKEKGMESIRVLVPGAEDEFVLNLFAAEGDSPERHAHITFAIIRELLNERESSAELSPAMEKLLRESVNDVVLEREEKTAASLEQIIQGKSDGDRISKMTSDALLNRLQILFREPLATVFGTGQKTLEISSLLDERVIVDLSYVARIGGMEAARLLYNVIVKRIFDCAMRRGIVEGLRHVVVLEEAYNLVPESYTRNSSADVTTGESMVMLQRATGQGVVVVSTRPNISSNILANTSTKITFRLPYDSAIGRRYLSLNDKQEEYLQSLSIGNALIKLPDVGVFEIKTLMPEYLGGELKTGTNDDEGLGMHRDVESDTIIEDKFYEDEESVNESDTKISMRKERILGEISGLVTGYLASHDFVVKEQLEQFLESLGYDDIEMTQKELVEDLISLSVIQREALPIVDGGFVFSVPGTTNESIKSAISQYIVEKTNGIQKFEQEGLEGSPDFIVESNAILIVPQRIRIRSIEQTIRTIRKCMMKVGNTIESLYVIVRGSIAAAKVRERIDNIDGYDLVTIVPAFQSSIDRMINACTDSRITNGKIPEIENLEIKPALKNINGHTKESDGKVSSRLWFGLLKDFLLVSGGKSQWNDFVSFVNTTAIQSRRARTVPLKKHEGLHALSYMIENGQLHLLRLEKKSSLCNLESGLWVLGEKEYQNIKSIALNAIRDKLERGGHNVVPNHFPFDFCRGNQSYAVLPTKDRLEQILHSEGEVACDSCKSKKAVCILGDGSILQEDTTIPPRIIIKYSKEGFSSILGGLIHG